MSSGTSVPMPRTSRSSGPRLTVSIQSVARSTPGAAGFEAREPEGDQQDDERPRTAPVTDLAGTFAF